MSKKIAVCIQAYNEDQFISKTIQSILNQTYSDFDLIISDNHSTDSTAAIINSYKSSDSRIISWKPPKFCKSLEHGRFIVNRVNSMDYESTIFIGAHDLIAPQYVELLDSAHQANPNAAIVVGGGSEIDVDGNILRKWPDVIQLKGGHISSRPFTVLMNLFYNLPAFGLWPSKIRKAVNFRHDCMFGDHLYVAEASLHGDIIVEPRAAIFTRRTVGVGENETFFKKHISDDMQISNIVNDFNKQIEWLNHIHELSYPRFPEASKNIIFSGMLGIYFSLFGITNLRSVDGALEAWLSSPIGVTLTSQMNLIGSSIKGSIPEFKPSL